MKWKYTTGERPNTITVLERKAGGILYGRMWDASARNGKGNWRYVSLGHRDRARAKSWAKQEVRKLEDGCSDIAQGKVSLATIFAQYLQHHSPEKVKSEQKADARRAEMWARVLGTTEPYDISSAQWHGFINNRRSGAIDSRGNAVPKGKRKPVRDRTIEGDCIWLWLVFNWAHTWRLSDGKYLMRENPIRGFKAPHEVNPRQPLATQDRFDSVRQVAESHTMEMRANRKRIKLPSYLPEMLDIVNGTGRRISAVCKLRFHDLRLERTAECPHGSIVWPADTEKTKRETHVPIDEDVRAAIDRIIAERPGIGTAFLFPRPNDPARHVSRHTADSWLRDAETMAGLAPLKGSLWHAYRRKWATERKHLPDRDVAAAGGWKSLEALKHSYQQIDAATMYQVVINPHQLRAAK